MRICLFPAETKYFFQFLSTLLLLLLSGAILISSVDRTCGIDIPPDTTISAHSQNTPQRFRTSNLPTLSKVKKKIENLIFFLTYAFPYWEIRPDHILGTYKEYISNVKVIRRHIHTAKLLFIWVSLFMGTSLGFCLNPWKKSCGFRVNRPGEQRSMWWIQSRIHQYVDALWWRLLWKLECFDLEYNGDIIKTRPKHTIKPESEAEETKRYLVIWQCWFAWRHCRCGERRAFAW